MFYSFMTDRLDDANFICKSVSPKYIGLNPELFAAWKVGLALRQNQHREAQRILQEYNWSWVRNLAKELVKRLDWGNKDSKSYENGENLLNELDFDPRNRSARAINDQNSSKKSEKSEKSIESKLNEVNQ